VQGQHHRASQACARLRRWRRRIRSQSRGIFPIEGSFAEYAIGSAAYVGRLPERPDFTALAPILCAGVTTWKGSKETEARPGEWIAISGVGGLGHVAVPYAKAMGLQSVPWTFPSRRGPRCTPACRRITITPSITGLT
jgi:propanol-preferring alcohol dehydrogenase